MLVLLHAGLIGFFRLNCSNKTLNNALSPEEERRYREETAYNMQKIQDRPMTF